MSNAPRKKAAAGPDSESESGYRVGLEASHRGEQTALQTLNTVLEASRARGDDQGAALASAVLQITGQVRSNYCRFPEHIARLAVARDPDLPKKVRNSPCTDSMILVDGRWRSSRSNCATEWRTRFIAIRDGCRPAIQSQWRGLRGGTRRRGPKRKMRTRDRPSQTSMRYRSLSPNSPSKKREKQMKHRRFSVLFISTILPIMLFGAAGAASGKSEIKGAAILDHPCGKVAVKQMGLVHAGKMEDANKLTTKEMQDQWKAMPAKDKTMMSGMMKDMSQTEAQYSADIKTNGLLVVDGAAATLTVKKETKDKNGSSSEAMTQSFKIDGGQCLVSR